MKNFEKKAEEEYQKNSAEYKRGLEDKMKALEIAMDHETDPEKYKSIAEELEETRLALEAFNRPIKIGDTEI